MEWYHVCWPRLTAKRIEPVVSISWASCIARVSPSGYVKLMSDRRLYVSVLLHWQFAGCIPGLPVHKLSFLYTAVGGRVCHVFANFHTVRTFYRQHRVPPLVLYSSGRHAWLHTSHVCFTGTVQHKQTTSVLHRRFTHLLARTTTFSLSCAYGTTTNWRCGNESWSSGKIKPLLLRSHVVIEHASQITLPAFFKILTVPIIILHRFVAILTTVWLM